MFQVCFYSKVFTNCYNFLYHEGGYFIIIITIITITVILLITSSSPAVMIQLVKHCPDLKSLCLLGYEDLSDIVLEFISGEHEDSPGLARLESLTLPHKSFVTQYGVRSLLKHLPLLHTVNFPGNTIYNVRHSQ